MIKIKNFIFTCFYILIVIYLLIFVPSIWGYKSLVVISGSMEPTLNVGSILYYHDKDYQDYEVGDILVYQLEDHIISHRIYDVTENGIITKGDANNTYDNLLVSKNQILGQGTDWCIPFLGYYADFIYTHKYLLYGVIILLLFDTVFEWYKERKSRKCKRE